MRRLVLASVSVFLAACAGESSPAASNGTGDTGGITAATLTGTSASADTASEEGGTAAGSGSAGTADGNSETAADPTGQDPGDPVDCAGTTYACADGIDNDKDGLIDLFDPECTGPCDDDESSFQTGIPGDNVDCKQDCFFDGNSGQGDDGCVWDLRCDPENPGADIGCEYTGGPSCDNPSSGQDKGCVDFCSPLVPPGCDCFGCCLVTDAEGVEVSVFLNSGPDCSLDNLDACQACTQSDDCVNTCDDCELCFGDKELPPECDGNECDNGDACMQNADCPPDWFCLQQCCYPSNPEG